MTQSTSGTPDEHSADGAGGAGAHVSHGSEEDQLRSIDLAGLPPAAGAIRKWQESIRQRPDIERGALPAPRVLDVHDVAALLELAAHIEAGACLGARWAGRLRAMGAPAGAGPASAVAPQQLVVAGTVVEVGDLEDESGARGIVVKRPDGLVTLKGLSIEETKSLGSRYMDRIDIVLGAAPSQAELTRREQTLRRHAIWLESLGWTEQAGLIRSVLGASHGAAPAGPPAVGAGADLAAEDLQARARARAELLAMPIDQVNAMVRGAGEPEGPTEECEAVDTMPSGNVTGMDGEGRALEKVPGPGAAGEEAATPDVGEGAPQ